MKSKFNSDPMSRFHSPRGKSKIITETDLAEKQAKSEWSVQLEFCKWLKHNYPDVKFRSDIQSAGKLSFAMQNITDIIDPFRGWPDVCIYLPRKNKYCGLMIELKRENSGTFLKDGSLSKAVHIQEQKEMHTFLKSVGWAVCFAEGVEKAKEMFLKYYNL